MKNYKFLKKLLVLALILIAGSPQLWAGTYTVVGVAMDNANNWYPRISVNTGGGDGCGWWNWCFNNNKAEITFEGKKLYLAEWTDCWNGTDAMYFQQYSTDCNSEKNNNLVHGSWVAVEDYNKKIYQYNESGTSGSWYSTLTMGQSKVYFDATGWSETDIDLCIAHMNYQAFYGMTHVDNTKLYYTNESYSWGDAMGFGVVGGYSRKDGQSATGYYWITDISSENAKEFTGFKHTALNNNDANYAYLVVNAGKAGQQPTVSSNSSYATLLNSTQTIKSYVSEDYGSSYDNANSKAAITITSFAMTSQGASGATSSNGSLSTSAKSTTVTSARTATTTLSVGTVADGYVFVGWYDGSGNALPDDGDGDLYTYTYYPTGATEVRAYFKNERTHTVTISNYCTTNTTTISSSSRSIGESTPVKITAPGINDHTFVSWTLGNGMTNHSANLNANPISVTTDGAGSTYTMRANYTLDNCSISVCSSSNEKGDGTKYNMTYDYDENAYYYDMASSPANLYFRFVHAGGGKWSADWNGSSPNVYDVDANGDDVTCNTNVSGWEYKATLHFSGLTGSPIRIWFDFQNKKTWITEATYTVTVNNGDHGTVSPNGSQSVGKNSGKSITATPSTGWKFASWTKTGSAVLSSTSTNPTTVTATGTGTVTPTYAHRFILRGSVNSDGNPAGGMAGWSANDNSDYVTATISDGVMTITANLTNAKTQYKCKIYDLVNTSYKGQTESTDIPNNTLRTLNGSNDVTFTTTCAGTYTFTYDVDANKFKVVYPTAYTVTFGMGDHEGSSSAITATASPSFSSGDYVLPETDITFGKGSTKTGYTWKGWYSNSNGSGTLHSSTDADLSWTATRTGNISVYACYDLVSYNITYTNMDGATNHGSNPDTYTIEDLPVTLYSPSKTGYTFSAWKAKNSSGSTVTSIAAGSKLQDTTLYATWTAHTYSVRFNANGGSGSMSNQAFTYDVAQNLTTCGFTKSGYSFVGWADSSEKAAAGTKDYDDAESVSNLSSTQSAVVDLYAIWSANNYTVTLSYESETGYGSSPSGVKESVSATYDATMPAMGTAPTPAPGYKFMGYFLGQNGTGVQYYDASGSSVINWNRAEATTLYAYFRKTEISSLTHPATVANGHEITVDVNPVFNQDGAENYLDICWKLLYDNGNVVEEGVAVASNPAEGKSRQVSFTLTDLASGYYKIQAVLKAYASSGFTPCSAGTKLDSVTSDLRIAGNSTVTILYQDASGNTIAASTSVEVAREDSIGVKAPSIVGYTFDEWTLGDVLSSSCRNAATCGLDKDSINIKAAYDGVLIAKYDRKNTIYFKNTLNWPAVYVNLLSGSYWSTTDGSGNNGQTNKNFAMTRLGTSDVWYYEYGATGTSDYISFTSKSQDGIEKFYGDETEVENDRVNVVYPTRPNYEGSEQTAYGFNVNTPMFVPLAGQTANKMTVTSKGVAYYYNKGYWAKYEPVSKETGYILKIFNKKNNSDLPDKDQAPVEIKSIPFTFSGDMTFPVHITTDLETSKTYGFKIYRDKGNSNDANSWYGNNNTMSNGHSGELGTTQGKWEFKTGTSNCGLLTAGSGNYTFTLDYDLDQGGSNYNYLVGVHYPEASGDYRVVFSDGVRSGILSHVIPKDAETDTISFFIDDTRTNVLKLQKCSVVYDPDADGGRGATTITWTDTVANLFTGGVLPAAITKKGVYYFCINKNPETGEKVLGDTKLYEGNFYIRTDGATPSKWDNFRQNNHLMAYSEYADLHENFTHSYTQWYDLTYRKNLKFTVANDYSVSISDTLTREDLTNISDYIDANGDLNRTANVRFMYNQKTNAISRAYIDGAYADGGDFLKIYAKTEDGIYLAAEGGEAQTQITFTDEGNWLYEKTVYAVPGARYKLKSIYGTTDGGKRQITQYFKGGAGSTAADSATIIGGTGSSRMQIRLIYDFKTNRVVTAYQPSGTINDNLEIHADIMFMREHQGDIDEITFASGKSISEIENIYCGLRFNKWTLNNKEKTGEHATLSPLLSRYERDIFYVSFPYDVKLSDVIGFGTYGQHWIVEYYDGAARAKNGFWVDSESYWKFVTPAMKDTFELKAGTGYIVALDLDELYYINESLHASIWDNTDINNLELLFPGKVTSISDIDVTYSMPKHTCTINRGTIAGNRTVKDSHWNVLGVPTFKNITGVETEDGGGSGAIRFANTAWIKDSMDLKFIYDGNLADNSLTPKPVKGFEFKAMHAYVVQYGGNVTFTTSATPAPASIVARSTYADKPQDVDFRLELSTNGVMEDQTFVSLSNDENVSADFEFGEDMSKEFNTNRANIYTFIGTEWVAGNTLPMINQTTIVPVGVKIATEGEYTFSIPEGTYGVGITLIDNETGARVNLGLTDYTVNLGEGQNDNRFLLEISPIAQTPTNIDNVHGDDAQSSKVRKVMVDGILYIVKDGKVYDARGNRVQ